MTANGYLKTAEAAELLGCTARRVRQMCAAGEIDYGRDERGDYLIPRTAVEARLARGRSPRVALLELLAAHPGGLERAELPRRLDGKIATRQDVAACVQQTVSRMLAEGVAVERGGLIRLAKGRKRGAVKRRTSQV